VELDLYLPASLRYFRGHFPGLPILPGVVQLHWAILYARERLGVRGEFKGLRALKFMKPIQPDRRIALRLEPFPGGFDFTYHSEAGKHAGGRVLLG
jgi:3-hydroxymyristoyl/3-hydroxydecanoyl-(acyl carrier protein) dehydratase